MAGETDGFVKIVAEKKYDEVLGVHIIGPRATELIAEAVLALRLECTVEELVKTIHAHPDDVGSHGRGGARRPRGGDSHLMIRESRARIRELRSGSEPRSIEEPTMSTPVVMPQMGESIAEGTIVRWIKKVGDAVDRDEPLFEISTDKVDAEIPSPAAGVLLDIAVKEGETVPVNSVVATIGAAGEKRAAARAAQRRTAGRTASNQMPEAAVGQPESPRAGGRHRRLLAARSGRSPRRRSRTAADGRGSVRRRSCAASPRNTAWISAASAARAPAAA